MHPIAGRFLDRTSPCFFFLGAVGLQVAAAILLLVSHTLGAFLIAACLLALGSASLWPLIYDTVGPHPAQEVRSRVTAMLALAGYVAITSLAGAYGPYVRLTLHITLLHTTMLLAPAALMALVSLGIAARFSRPHRRLGEMALLYVLSAAGAFGLAATSTPWVAGVFAVALGAGMSTATAPSSAPSCPSKDWEA